MLPSTAIGELFEVMCDARRELAATDSVSAPLLRTLARVVVPVDALRHALALPNDTADAPASKGARKRVHEAVARTLTTGVLERVGAVLEVMRAICAHVCDRVTVFHCCR
jgi:hypothetical protein